MYRLAGLVPASAAVQQVYSSLLELWSSIRPPWAHHVFVALKEATNEHDEGTTSNIIILSVAVILCLTLLFEVLHEVIVERLEHKGLHHALAILRCVNKEMTILGFIALLLFSFTRFGWVMRANDALMGQSHLQRTGIEELKEEGQNPYAAPTVLSELFEEVHLTVFFLMVGFFFVVGGLLLLTLRRTEKWRRYDATALGDLQRLIREERVTEDQLKYWYLRYRFMNPASPLLLRADPGCSFSEYMSERLTAIVVELVEIPLKTWAFLLLLALLAQPVLGFDSVQKLIFLTCLSGGLVFCTVLLYCSLSTILQQLTPPASLIARHIVELTRPGYREAVPAAPLDTQPPIRRNDGFCALLRGGHITNSQEALFLLGRRGPRVLRTCIQILVFVHVIAIACLAKLLWSAAQHGALTRIYPIWSGAKVIVPLLCVLTADLCVCPSIAVRYTKLTSVGYFAGHVAIQRSKERQQRKKMARDFQIAVYLQHKANVFATTQAGNNLQRDLSRAKTAYEALPLGVQRGFQDLFHAFAELEGETPRISRTSLRLMASVFGLEERTPDCKRKIGKGESLLSAPV